MNSYTGHWPGAGDGNRTRVSCLEGRCSTIELHRRICFPAMPNREAGETGIEPAFSWRRLAYGPPVLTNAPAGEVWTASRTPVSADFSMIALGVSRRAEGPDGTDPELVVFPTAS